MPFIGALGVFFLRGLGLDGLGFLYFACRLDNRGIRRRRRGLGAREADDEQTAQSPNQDADPPSA